MKIVVLCGGVSTERDVSLVTGRMIYEALKRKGHQVVLADVFLGFGEEKDLSQDIFSLDIDWAKDINPVKDANPDLTSVKAMRPDYEKNFFGPGVIPVCQQADVVFMALHGENGENGKIQACFDLMGIRYTGTDYLSSALAMDKGITKDIFRQYGVPTPAGTRLKRGEKDLRIVPLPCVVKAACGGSSVGVSIARTEEEYEAAKVDAFQYDNEVIIGENNTEISMLLSAKRNETAAAVRRLMGENEKLRARSAELCRELARQKAEMIEPTEGSICIFDSILDEPALRALVNEAVKKCSGVAAVFSGSDERGYRYIIGSRTVDLRKAAKSINEGISGRGGGSPEMIQGSCTACSLTIQNFLTNFTF